MEYMEWTNASTYQAAQKVSGDIAAHFQRHLQMGREQGEEELATAPGREHIELMIDVAFWASLRREEGLPTRISMAFLHPSQAGKPLLFEFRIPLSPKALTKLAPGVERAGAVPCLERHPEQPHAALARGRRACQRFPQAVQ